MIPEGIEPSIFGTGIRRVAIAPWNHLLEFYRLSGVSCAGLFWLLPLGIVAEFQKGGDTGIEPATSCTQSRNHTTRPITRLTIKKLHPVGFEPTPSKRIRT
jgi:hypothetical protein